MKLFIITLCVTSSLLCMEPDGKKIVLAHVMSSDTNGKLVAIGVDGKLPDGKTTLLHVCIDQNMPKQLKKYLKKGALVDTIDREGNTPLIAAALCNNYECAKILFEHGADAGRCNDIGMRAWDFVEARKYIQLIDLFKKYNAHMYSNLGWSDDYSSLEIIIDRREVDKLPREKREHFLQVVREYEADKASHEKMCALRKACLMYGFLKNEPRNLTIQDLKKFKNLELRAFAIPFNEKEFKKLSGQQVRAYIAAVKNYSNDSRKPEHLAALIKVCKEYQFI